MNRKGQNEVARIIEGIFAVIILFAMLPLFFQLGDIAKPQKEVIVNNTAVEQARNLSTQLEICQKNYQELNKSVVTKQDITDLATIVRGVNQNVLNIYDMNNTYIQNNISLTIKITITLTLMFTLFSFAILDAALFKFELAKSFFRAVKRRFGRTEQEEQNG